MNKGIKISSGDIVGILNSDDVLDNHNIVSTIARKFINNKRLDCIIGDISFVNKKNKVIRRCSSKKWSLDKFEYGIMPPHPSFYCKKKAYLK